MLSFPLSSKQTAQSIEASAKEKAEDARKQKLEDKRERKEAVRSWAQIATTAFIGIVTALIGAVLERYTFVLDWLVGLFH